MKFNFPENRLPSITNKGEALGDTYFTHGIDLTTEPGRILSSPNAYKCVDEDTVATFTNPVGRFLVYDNRWWGTSDVVMRGASNSSDNPVSGWAADNTASSPSLDWQESDAVVFNSLLLVSGVSGGGDIYAYNGTTWSSWWTGTLAQAALSSTGYKPMVVGPNGRLYIVDGQNKVYNVTTGGTVTKTGNGTLSFSATSYKFYVNVVSSSRMWLGGLDTASGESIVVEWDMSLNEATPNRIHKPGAHGVASIVIWDDSPVLFLSDGTMRFFNGTNFYSETGASLPRPPVGCAYTGDDPSNAIPLPGEFIVHSNGSAIIDGLPHFLIDPVVDIYTYDGSSVTKELISPQLYAGVYCYDPSIGLYNRFPIERNGGTTGFGASYTNNLGALAYAGSKRTKFLASADIFYNSTNKSVIFTDDQPRTLASRGRIALTPFIGTSKDLWEKVETYTSLLKNSSDRILLKYRLKKDRALPIVGEVTWVSSTQFTTTDTDFASALTGHMVLVARGNGAGCTAHISSISYSAPTYTVTLDEAVTGVSASDTSQVMVDNYRRLATISNQRTDYNSIGIPATESSHTFWLMVELRAAAGSVVELDKIIVTSNEG